MRKRNPYYNNNFGLFLFFGLLLLYLSTVIYNSSLNANSNSLLLVSNCFFALGVLLLICFIRDFLHWQYFSHLFKYHRRKAAQDCQNKINLRPPAPTATQADSDEENGEESCFVSPPSVSPAANAAPQLPALLSPSISCHNHDNSIKAFDYIFSNIPRMVLRINPNAKPTHINVSGYYPQISYLRKNASYKSLRDFVAIDVETTGLEVGYQKIIQISAVRFLDLKAIEMFETYVNPGKHIPLTASEINHITDDMVSDAPYFEQILDSLDNFIGQSPLVSHNIPFDIRFLRKSGYDNEKYPRKYYDTLQISRSRDKYIDNHKLTTVCEEHNIFFDNAHTSSADALACGLLFLSYIRSDVESCFGLESEYDHYKELRDMYRNNEESGSPLT